MKKGIVKAKAWKKKIYAPHLRKINVNADRRIKICYLSFVKKSTVRI